MKSPADLLAFFAEHGLESHTTEHEAVFRVGEGEAITEGGGTAAADALGRATDLAGFPPCFMAVGDIDLFAIEDLAFAQGLMAAGVPVELHVYPGAYHGFVLVTAAGVAQKFERDCRDALARALTQPAHPPAQEGNTV